MEGKLIRVWWSLEGNIWLVHIDALPRVKNELFKWKNKDVLPDWPVLSIIPLEGWIGFPC